MYLEAQLQVYSSRGRGDHPCQSPKGGGQEAPGEALLLVSHRVPQRRTRYLHLFPQTTAEQCGFCGSGRQPAPTRLQYSEPGRVPRAASPNKAESLQAESSVLPVNKSKRKRNRRKENRRKEISLKILGNNVNSLAQKFEALEHVLVVEKPAVIFLQETRLGRPGRIKTPNSQKYTWYELLRTNMAEKGQKGGGIAIGVLQSLEPSWISEGNDNTETITVEIWLKEIPVRLICGYGPQEYDNKQRKDGFWDYLNKEVLSASTAGAGFILQMDGNLWPGENIVKGDLKIQNQNGKMFENFLLQNPHLSVVNALPLCDGKFTRVMTTKTGTTKTILDFFVVCNKMLPHVTKMKIDESGATSLTRYKNKIVKTDHNMLSLEIDLTFHTEKHHDRIEMFNLRNINCQQKFKEYTSKNTKLSECFLTGESVKAQFNNWQRKFQKALYASFRKIRVTDRKKDMSLIDKLMKEKKRFTQKEKS